MTKSAGRDEANWLRSSDGAPHRRPHLKSFNSTTGIADVAIGNRENTYQNEDDTVFPNSPLTSAAPPTETASRITKDKGPDSGTTSTTKGLNWPTVTTESIPEDVITRFFVYGIPGSSHGDDVHIWKEKGHLVLLDHQGEEWLVPDTSLAEVSCGTRWTSIVASISKRDGRALKSSTRISFKAQNNEDSRRLEHQLRTMNEQKPLGVERAGFYRDWMDGLSESGILRLHPTHSRHPARDSTATDRHSLVKSTEENHSRQSVPVAELEHEAKIQNTSSQTPKDQAILGAC